MDFNFQCTINNLSLTKKFLLENKVLQHPFFVHFLVMRFTLILGLQMQAAIISYFVYRLTYNENTHKGDPVVLGLIGLWEVIPAIGFSLFSGHFVDISEKKKLISKCLLGYFILSIFFALIAFPQMQNYVPKNSIIWLAFLGIFIGGMFRAFLSPASFALLGIIVPKELIPNATTWSSASWQIGAVVGPLLAGVMIACTGFQTSLFMVGLFIIISFINISFIPKQPVIKKEKEPILKSLTEGIKFVFGTQIILAVLTLDMFAVLFGGAVALLPVYADDILKVGEIGFGWLRSAPAIGAVVALLRMSVKPVKNNPGLKLFLCFIGFGISTIIFGYCGFLGSKSVWATIGGLNISGSFLLAFSMLLLGGMFDAVNVVIRHIILQLNTPHNMRGRVAAVNTIFISSSNELGAMESGITAKWMGTVPAVVFGGCMTIAVVAITWFIAPVLKTFKIEDE